MNTRAFLLFALLLAALGPGAASASAAEEDFLYDPGTVNVIEIKLGPTQIAELEVEPREYVEDGEVVLKKSDGTPAGIGAPSPTFKGVEVKLKGQPGGSFEDLGGKAAFKLKFDKNELFYGVRKLTLNNMTQDPSMVHESLAYTAFGAAGVPSSRSGYAFVYLNGINYGLHANVESLDTLSLPRIFGVPFDKEKQHLYEAAEYGADFYPGKEPMFEVDEGKDKTPADIADLTNAIAAVEGNGSAQLTTNLAPFFDFAELTRMWAAEKYIGHWDGYAGQGIAGEEGFNLHRPNNYYLYSDTQGRFSMLPWGADQTWGGKPGSSEELEFDEQDGRLFDFCLEDATCAGLFSGAVANALDKVGGLDLALQTAETEAMLAPWQALEVAPRKPSDAAEIAAAVDDTCDFIAKRPAEAEAWLNGEPPTVAPIGNGCPPWPPPPIAVIDPVAGTPGPANPGTPPRTTVAIPRGTPASLHLRRLAKLGDRVRIELEVSAPGGLVLRGRSPLDGRRRQVCRDEVRANGPGKVTLVCRLSPRALRRLGNHALPVVLRTVFTPDGGTAALDVRQVTLPRR